MHRPCRECAGTDRAGTVQGPCIECSFVVAWTVQGLTVQGVCIKCSLCRDRAWTVQGPCMECSFVVAWTVQGPCIDCPELNDQLAIFFSSFKLMIL